MRHFLCLLFHERYHAFVSRGRYERKDCVEAIAGVKHTCRKCGHSWIEWDHSQ